MSSPAIAEAAHTIDSRLKELKPAYDEYLALEGLRTQMTKALPEGVLRQKPTRRRTATSAGNGRRGETMQAVKKLVMENPSGISVQEIAESLEKQPSYIYAVVSRLIDRHVLRREGKLVYPRQRVAVTKG